MPWREYDTRVACGLRLGREAELDPVRAHHRARAVAVAHGPDVQAGSEGGGAAYVILPLVRLPPLPVGPLRPGVAVGASQGFCRGLLNHSSHVSSVPRVLTVLRLGLESPVSASPIARTVAPLFVQLLYEVLEGSPLVPLEKWVDLYFPRSEHV